MSGTSVRTHQPFGFAMAEFLNFNWPFSSLALLIICSGIISAWLIPTLIVVRVRTTKRQRIVRLIEQAAAEHDPIVACVIGDGEAVAVGASHLYWIDCHTPTISFSMSLDEITHLKIIDEDPNVMKFSFRLASKLETRVLRTRDVLQATQLFRFIQSQGKAIDYLAR